MHRYAGEMINVKGSSSLESLFEVCMYPGDEL